MKGKAHYRVRGVRCGKCDRIHTWYKYLVWREGKKVKEKYIGKCDAFGNMTDADFGHSSQTWWKEEKQRKQQWENTISQQDHTPYEVLGVSYTATTEQIKKAYRDLVKKYHPDVNKQADPKIIAQINVAYHILMKR